MSVRSLRYNSLMLGQAKYRSASTDSDAAAFLEAAGIYKSDQRKAIYELVRLLKQYGLWSKMKAIYPFIGGTATTHKWNLKDPRDLDAAFRLSFQGGWTHSSTGADPNGTNGYADTFLTPSATLLQNSTHISYYSRENSTNTEVEMGSQSTATSGKDRLFIEANTSGVSYITVNGDVTGVGSGLDFVSFTDTDARAYYIGSRTSSTVMKGYKNGVSQGTNDKQSTTPSTQKIIIGAYQDQLQIRYFSTKQCAFATIGDGLTDTEVANLHWAVDKYQRLLSRNV